MGDEPVLSEVVSCDAVAGEIGCTKVVNQFYTADDNYDADADRNNVHSDNLGDRHVSFDNALLRDGEFVDIAGGVPKEDTVTNVTYKKCNTEKNQTQATNTGINENILTCILISFAPDIIPLTD